MPPKPVKHIANQGTLRGFGTAVVGTGAVAAVAEEWDKNPHCIWRGAVCYKHDGGVYVRVPCVACAVCGESHV